jgi:hypothetical protein
MASSDLIQKIADLIEQAGIEEIRSIFDAVEDEIRKRRMARHEAYKQKHNLRTSGELRAAYDLTEAELETARIEGLLTAVPESTVPGPSLAPTLYEPLTESVVQRLRETTYVSTQKAVAFLGVSEARFRALRAEGHIERGDEKWMQRYPSHFYRMKDLRRLRSQLEAEIGENTGGDAQAGTEAS